MNTQTESKSYGQIAYEAFPSASDGASRDPWENTFQYGWERVAQAIIAALPKVTARIVKEASCLCARDLGHDKFDARMAAHLNALLSRPSPDVTKEGGPEAILVPAGEDVPAGTDAEPMKPIIEQRGAFTIKRHGAHVFEKKRRELGMKVREVWIAWAKEQPNPKSSWLTPWEELNEPDKEVDRRIGETLYQMGLCARQTSAPEVVSAPSTQEGAELPKTDGEGQEWEEFEINTTRVKPGDELDILHHWQLAPKFWIGCVNDKHRVRRKRPSPQPSTPTQEPGYDYFEPGTTVIQRGDFWDCNGEWVACPEHDFRETNHFAAIRRPKPSAPSVKLAQRIADDSQKVVTCPVCAGRKWMPHGFFSGFVSGTDCANEPCQICNSNGLILISSPLLPDTEALQKEVETITATKTRLAEAEILLNRCLVRLDANLPLAINQEITTFLCNP